MKTIHTVLAAAMAAAVGCAHAQSIKTLDPVVVTASRVEEPARFVTGYVETFSSAQIRNSGSASIPEFLSRVGGFNLRTTNAGPLGVLSTVDLRGFGASAKDNTLILLDGQRLNPIDGGGFRWESVPIELVDRIEVLHGSGAVQFGDRAVGGTINVITRKPDKDRVDSSLSLGSFGRASVYASREASFDDSNLALSLSNKNDDGWRDNSGANETLATVRFLKRINTASSVDLATSVSSQRYASPGGVLGEVNAGDRRAAKFNNVDDKTKTTQGNLTFGLNQHLRLGWVMNAHIGYLKSDQQQQTPFSTTSVKRIQYYKSRTTSSIQLSREGDDRNLSVIGLDWAGSEAQYQPNTGDLQNADLTDLSVFYSQRVLLASNWIGNTGVRVQQQSAEAFDLTQTVGTTQAFKRQYGHAAQLGLSYTPYSGGLERISLSFSRSYRFANTDEYWASAYGPPPSFTQTRVFAGILRPQRTDGVDLALEGRSPLLRGSGTIFASRSSDEIRYCVSATCNFGSNVNSDRINRYGITGRMLAALSRRVDLNIGGTLQRARFSAGEFNGKRIALIPERLLNASVTWRTKAQVQTILRIRYVGPQLYEGDESNSLNRMPGFSVADLQVSTQKDQWTISAGVNNLFDKRYANFGGHGFVSLAPGSGGFSYYHYPGDPASIFFTLSRQFD